ncbi:hypothetical protein G7Z17_g2508 [Cylindrodendrum hubeiense]|uniref:Uncharacterized protein n=1 Tax=Cylindrodendrum hubeiense TaxID=595255 RepID=A0A9P5HMY8_9HYPO|nr:hypothetical protein G7Z17_g2508 [Cylindrodendrum hubeiense]
MPSSTKHTASTNGHASKYEIEDLYHSEIKKPMKMICVGSGMSGMYLAFRILKRMQSFDLTIYEKNPDVGGTYPGCACDIPAHLYNFYDKNGLSRFAKLSHRWEVEVEDLQSGCVKTDKCDILVNATGFLNKWKWPEIEGIDTFTQPKVHSAAWNDSIEFEDKVIGVIGTGSSAIQIIPQMQKIAKQLKVFMRSPTWITPAIGGKTSSQFRGEDSDANMGHEQFTFSEELKQRFRADPDYHLRFRKRIEAEVNWMADIFTVGTDMQKEVQETMTEQMKRRIGEENAELAEKLIPSWPPGCRRLTPGDQYLESLVKPNVETVFGSIQKIDDKSVFMADGSRHELDVLVKLLILLP